MLAINLSKQQTLDNDPKVMQQVKEICIHVYNILRLSDS